MVLDWLSVATGTGIFIGSFLTLLFQFLLKRKENIDNAEFEYKKTRYLCIIILMMTLLEPGKRLKKTLLKRPEFTGIEDVKEEIDAEYLCSIIYASSDVIKTMKAFIESVNEENYQNAVLAMRKDLWGSKGKIAAKAIPTK